MSHVIPTPEIQAKMLREIRSHKDTADRLTSGVTLAVFFDGDGDLVRAAYVDQSALDVGGTEGAVWKVLVTPQMARMTQARFAAYWDDRALYYAASGDYDA